MEQSQDSLQFTLTDKQTERILRKIRGRSVDQLVFQEAPRSSIVKLYSTETQDKTALAFLEQEELGGQDPARYRVGINSHQYAWNATRTLDHYNENSASYNQAAAELYGLAAETFSHLERRRQPKEQETVDSRIDAAIDNI